MKMGTRFLPETRLFRACATPPRRGPTPPRRGPTTAALAATLLALAPFRAAPSLATPVVQPLPAHPAPGDEPMPGASPYPQSAPYPQSSPYPQSPPYSQSIATTPAPPPAIATALLPGITEGAEWDRAHTLLLASPPSPAESAIAPAIATWRSLCATDALAFADYAAFLLAYPGFPEETKLRLTAEKALAAGRPGLGTTPQRIAAYFDRFPPLTNPAAAQYALALAALARPDAAPAARTAWRGGSMSDSAESAIRAQWGTILTQADHDARLDSLLWDGNLTQAQRALNFASPPARAIALSRIALQQGRDPQAPVAQYPASPYPAAPATPYPATADTTAPAEPGTDPDTAAPLPPSPPYLPGTPPAPAVTTIAPPPPPPGALADPGYLQDRARFLIRHGRAGEAASLLAEHLPLSRPAADPRRWLALSLAIARDAGPNEAIRIAERAGEAFPPGTDLSAASFTIRDQMTSLLWLGGTQALWWRGDRPRAAALFRAYAAASRTPQSRAKGQFWAGRALAPIDPAAATRAYEAAAAYPDQFYGLLALQALHSDAAPLLARAPAEPRRPTRSERAAFNARPLTAALRLVARDADWQTTIRFFRAAADAAADSATPEAEFTLLADLARELGRRDLAVITGTAAETAGFANFRDAAFPLIPTPATADWTAVHAVARQESQFAQNAISSAGARGLMQLMPATAAEQARRLGVPYSTSALIADPMLNLATGNAYFTHLLSVYNGSWPLAAAAYNAGPGNVARWLRSLGDPRTSSMDWPDWIERIPVTETRGYVQHIVENAVVYEARNPAHAHYTGPDAIGYFLKGK